MAFGGNPSAGISFYRGPGGVDPSAMAPAPPTATYRRPRRPIGTPPDPGKPLPPPPLGTAPSVGGTESTSGFGGSPLSIPVPTSPSMGTAIPGPAKPPAPITTGGGQVIPGGNPGWGGSLNGPANTPVNSGAPNYLNGDITGPAQFGNDPFGEFTPSLVPDTGGPSATPAGGGSSRVVNVVLQPNPPAPVVRVGDGVGYGPNGFQQIGNSDAPSLGASSPWAYGNISDPITGVPVARPRQDEGVGQLGFANRMNNGDGVEGFPHPTLPARRGSTPTAPPASDSNVVSFASNFGGNPLPANGGSFQRRPRPFTPSVAPTPAEQAAGLAVKEGRSPVPRSFFAGPRDPAAGRPDWLTELLKRFGL